MKKNDLIIIGAGPGGYRAAEYAAKNGLKVVIFEGGHVGGTCLNEGCIPTKSFARNAGIVETLKNSEEFGLNALHYGLDFQKVVARKDEVVLALRTGIETLLSHPNITCVKANARFADDHSVEANGEVYVADHIVIATGSESKTLRLERCEGRILDSRDLLQIDHLPKSLCIVGAGVIGMEFASIFNSFGTEVTVVEFLKECLPALDCDIAKRLRKSLEKRGVAFHMQCAVKAIVNGEVIFTNKKGQTESVTAEEVLMAVGRRPRTDGLNLDAVGITLTPQGAIPVDDNLLVIPPSSFLLPPSSSIYAIGDVNGKQMLAHAAEAQAIYVVKQIVNGKLSNCKYLDIMPAAIFTNPEAACVGPTEDQLKAEGIPYVCKKSFWRANGKALAMNETDGLLKLFVGADGKLLGCHAYGAHAADIVQEVSVLMCKDTTVQELADMVHIHPTLSEILKNAAE